MELYCYSYTPEVYQRTGHFLQSLQVDDVVEISISGMTLTVKVYFNENAYHHSGDGIRGWIGNGQTVNTARLLNYGYHVNSDVWFSDIPNFGYREPAHFIEDGVQDFLKHNPYKLTVKIDKGE